MTSFFDMLKQAHRCLFFLFSAPPEQALSPKGAQKTVRSAVFWQRGKMGLPFAVGMGDNMPERLKGGNSLGYDKMAPGAG
jgi:hypothetical protein